MKNFFSSVWLSLILSLFLAVFCIPSMMAYSEPIIIDTIPEVKFDSISNAYIRVEKMPVYPEGEKALMKFISENIKYPPKAQEAGIQGFVIVQFLIDKTGKITDPKVVRGIGGGCDEEAIRVVKLMPAWTPGYHKAEPVPVMFTLPIRFKLSTT